MNYACEGYIGNGGKKYNGNKILYNGVINENGIEVEDDSDWNVIRYNRVKYNWGYDLYQDTSCDFNTWSNNVYGDALFNAPP